MKPILLILTLSLFACTCYSQSVKWVKPGEHSSERIKIRTDTINGRIVIVGRKEVLIYPCIEVDSVTSYYTEVGCPENRIGCMVLHYGWVDGKPIKHYYINYVEVLKKLIILFIPD